MDSRLLAARGWAGKGKELQLGTRDGGDGGITQKLTKFVELDS